MNILVTGYPRSGTHRILQTIYSLIYKMPFPFHGGYGRLRQEHGIIVSHKLPKDLKADKFIHTKRQLPETIVSLAMYTKTNLCAVTKWVHDGFTFPRGNPGEYIHPMQKYLYAWSDRHDTIYLDFEQYGEQDVKQIADFIGVPYLAGIPEWNSKKRLMLEEQKAEFSPMALTYFDNELVLTPEMRNVINEVFNVM